MRLPVEMPPKHNDIAGLTGGTMLRTLWLDPKIPTPGNDLLTAMALISESAHGDGMLRLLWTADNNVEMGWWADYLEMHIAPHGKWVSPKLGLPVTVEELETWGPGVVSRTELGTLKMLPGEVLNINLSVPDVAAPWNTGPGMVMIHGLQLTYEG